MCSTSRLFCVFTSLALAGICLDAGIKFGEFQHVYNHWLKNCTKYSLNGSEDIAVFPNQKAVFSSGLYFHDLEGIINKPPPKMYMLDLNMSEQGPIELAMDIDKEEFNPHGASHWISLEGDYIVYVVNHRQTKDTIESFYFKYEEERLQHRGSFEHQLFHQLNDIVVVGLDEFYVTVDRYFSHPIVKTVESMLRLPLSNVVYFNNATQSGNIVAGGLMYANGIAQSNNQRFVYVSNIGATEIAVYRRQHDNSLQFTQAIKLREIVDNIFIDPTNGHMWVASFPRPLHMIEHIHNRSVPVEGRILHIRLFEEQEEPFSYERSTIEEMFETDGIGFGAITIAVYCNNKLVMGTVVNDLMICENVHTSF